MSNGIKTAIAIEELEYNDPVVIENGYCRRATHFDLSTGIPIFHSITKSSGKGSKVNLAGGETIFDIQK